MVVVLNLTRMFVFGMSLRGVSPLPYSPDVTSAKAKQLVSTYELN